MFGLLPIVTFAALFASSVHGHGVLLAATGANGVTGKGFAVVDGTPRNSGAGIRKNEGDTSIIRDKEIASGKVGGCGRTEFGGPTDVAAQLAASSAAGMPTVGADGSVTMTLHQVNGDGAGPYTCEVSADGTANTFAAMTVTQNVPGNNGRSNNKATDFQLVAAMPAGTTCTGGPNGDACVVRCRNPARAGPFGGCVAVAQDSGAGAAAAATGVAAAGTGAAAAAAPAAAAAGAAQAVTTAAAAAAAAATVAAASPAAASSAAVASSATGTEAGVAAQGAAAEAAPASAAGTAAQGVAAAAAPVSAAGTAAQGVAAEAAPASAAGTAAEAAPASAAGTAASAGSVKAAAGNVATNVAKKVTKRYISSRIMGARRLSAWI